MDRLARALVGAAARRWPEEMADEMRAAWLAELAAIPGWWRRWAFAGSLAISPGVDEPSWGERASAAGRAAAVAGGVTLAAAVATNLARGAGALAPAVLAVCVLALGVVGARRRGSVVLVGAALFGFLLAGNPVAVMPFMGARDIAPAVGVWMAGMAGARRRGPAGAAVGGAVVLGLATAAGSVHAAATLGVSGWTAPAWFPLALLPGGTVSFGPVLPGGAPVGTLQAAGPTHASAVLLANAAVMAGPMMLCTAFVLAPALRIGSWKRTAAARFGAGVGPRTAAPPTATNGVARRGNGDVWRAAAGMGAALGALAVAPRLPAGGAEADVVARLVDNSMAFGFGFVEHPVGLGATALLAAVLAMRVRPAAG
ncbi:hypothetical protein [Actinoplanes sp. URMC 104]|uniref:hypothetical protein n=1 Tax=Actinoplanes sp. URMC 104 TaxID=3423409 RepID=UPI003F1CC4EC